MLKRRLKLRTLAHRDRLLPVHDWDFKNWSIEIAEELELEPFKASKTFITNFKKTHKFTSRKITKFVTRVDRQNEQEIQANAAEFVQRVNSFRQEYFLSFGSNWNTDQSGFEYEMTSGRTLSIKRKKLQG